MLPSIVLLAYSTHLYASTLAFQQSHQTYLSLYQHWLWQLLVCEYEKIRREVEEECFQHLEISCISIIIIVVVGNFDIIALLFEWYWFSVSICMCVSSYFGCHVTQPHTTLLMKWHYNYLYFWPVLRSPLMHNAH